MKNWRPITLLCVDYKIAAKAIANRLLHVLPSIIHPNQSGGVRGRSSTPNTRLLQDIVHDINARGLGGAILSLDQEKASGHGLSRYNFQYNSTRFAAYTISYCYSSLTDRRADETRVLHFHKAASERQQHLFQTNNE